MTGTASIDGLLEQWGETFFNPATFWGPSGRPSRAAGGSAPRDSPRSSMGQGGSLARSRGRLDARAVRQRLNDVLRRSPQVMVKVYGGGRGMKQVRAHLRYIARAGREGEVAIEDQDGFRSLGVEAIRELSEDWQFGEVEIQEVSARREALNVVLSMPAGTDPISVQKAARDFAASEFANHKYAMALHTLDTPHYAGDTRDPPSPHPHVHLVVQASGQDGTRLNPRKADLHRWREGFAQALRDHGVDAVATSRAHRLDRRRGSSQAVRQMKDRGKAFTNSGRGSASPGKVASAKTTEKAILNRYREVARILAASANPTDRAMSMSIADRFGFERPGPPQRGSQSEFPRRSPEAPEPRDPSGKGATYDLERS